MKKIYGEQSLPIQKCLVLNALIKKRRLSYDDYKNYLLASRLDDPEENDHIPVDLLETLNAWLGQFGNQSFRDLAHLQRIADLIQRAYWATQGKGPVLDPMEGNDLVDWMSECEENRKFFVHLTDPEFPHEIDDLNLNNVCEQIIRKPLVKIIWSKVLRIFTGGKKDNLKQNKSDFNMN